MTFTLFGRRKPEAVEPTKPYVPEIPPSKFLHGHNMDEWIYLGHVILEMDSIKHPTFLFCRKDDINVRSYTITGADIERVKRYHQYVSCALEPWRFGESDLYKYVLKNPSKWLQDYMMEKYTSVWNYEENWWVKANEAQKYKGAVKSQKKKENNKESKASEPVNNVITVNFKK